jgi:predicted transcriptional regulator
MTEYVTTNIRLPKELYRRLKRQALEEEKSLSQIVRESVTSYLTGTRFPGPEAREEIAVEEDEHDPLWLIGRDPVIADVTDGSVNHDLYLYGPLSDRAQAENGQ